VFFCFCLFFDKKLANLVKIFEMRPQLSSLQRGQTEMFSRRLDVLLDESHELVRLSLLIDWSVFDRQYDSHYHPSHGAPALPTRRMVALQLLKYMYDLSDEALIARWLENPYWQYFSGESYFQYRKPCDPSQLSRWRKRIGDEKLKLVLQETIRIAKERKMLSIKNMSEVIVDTTVQEKNIAYPTDAKLHYRAILNLVSMCKTLGIKLRQSYTRKSKVRYRDACRSGSRRNSKELQKANRDLKNWLGRILRDITRHCDGVILSEQYQILLATATKLYNQSSQTPGKERVYSIHEPTVCAIAKGKERIRYEYGNKVSVLKTNDKNFILNVENCPGNPYDGHTLAQTISNGEKMTGVTIREISTDKHYEQSDYQGEAKILIHGTSNTGLRPCEKRRKKRRSSIEPIIGHLKSGHRLCRNFLQGTLGDILNAIGAAAGFNMRKILSKL
jgi:IS5 family transposase